MGRQMQIEWTLTHNPNRKVCEFIPSAFLRIFMLFVNICLNASINQSIYVRLNSHKFCAFSMLKLLNLKFATFNMYENIVLTHSREKY